MIPLIKPTFPDIKKAERYFEESKKTSQFTNFGPLHKSLVQRLSIITNSHAVPVNNGTTAIELALVTMGLNGKRVIVPDFTHSGTYLAVKRAGAEPILMSAVVSLGSILCSLPQNINSFGTLSISIG